MVQNSTVSLAIAQPEHTMEIYSRACSTFRWPLGSSSEELQETSKVVVEEPKLMLEELTTLLAQTEACLNSRPLTPLPEASATGITSQSCGLVSANICPMTMASMPNVSTAFLVTLVIRISWHSPEVLQVTHPSHNLQGNDAVCLLDEPSAPTKWPLASITEIHPGHD